MTSELALHALLYQLGNEDQNISRAAGQWVEFILARERNLT